jgi:predicted RNase H-like HicB family nuclease
MQHRPRDKVAGKMASKAIADCLPSAVSAKEGGFNRKGRKAEIPLCPFVPFAARIIRSVHFPSCGLLSNRLEIRTGRFQIRLRKQLTAIIHHGEPSEGGFWATCLKAPGANGQGETKDECLRNLAQAVQLLLNTGREEAFRLGPQAEMAELLLA